LGAIFSELKSIQAKIPATGQGHLHLAKLTAVRRCGEVLSSSVSEDYGGVLAMNNHAQLGRSADCDDAGEALQPLLGAGSRWSAAAASSRIASVNAFPGE